MTDLPAPVRSAFHADAGEVITLGPAWDNGWRVGHTAIMPVVDSENAAFSAKLRVKLSPVGVQVVRPVRSTDGRYVVSGWRASVFVAGELQAGRVDETVIAALRLAEAMADTPIPDFARAPIAAAWKAKNLFTVADRAAWSDDPAGVLALGLDSDSEATPAMEFALRLAARLSPLTPPVMEPDQIGHADMLATTIFAGSQAPVVTDLVVVAHPAAYTAAQTMIDGLLLDAVDPGIIRRFEHLPDIMALLLRSLLYRTFIHALHSEARPEMEDRLARVADYVIKGA